MKTIPNKLKEWGTIPGTRIRETPQLNHKGLIMAVIGVAFFTDAVKISSEKSRKSTTKIETTSSENQAAIKNAINSEDLSQ